MEPLFNSGFAALTPFDMSSVLTRPVFGFGSDQGFGSPFVNGFDLSIPGQLSRGLFGLPEPFQPGWFPQVVNPTPVLFPQTGLGLWAPGLFPQQPVFQQPWAQQPLVWPWGLNPGGFMPGWGTPPILFPATPGFGFSPGFSPVIFPQALGQFGGF